MAQPIVARPKQTMTRELTTITLHEKSDPPAPAPALVPAPVPAARMELRARTPTAGEPFVQRAIGCLLLLILLALVALLGVASYFVVEIKPLVALAHKLHPHVEPAVGALTQLSRMSEELQPAVAALTSLTTGVNVSSLAGGSVAGILKNGLAELPETVSLTFSQIVRDFGPPQSIPNLITHALSTNFGNLTSALVRIGRKLEPKLVHFRFYDYGFASFAGSLSQLFQAVEYLDGPIHEAEAEVFGVVQPPLNSDGDIAATLSHWLGKAPVEYVVAQLNQDAWNHTTVSCRSLREELSIIMTKLSIVHPHLDMHNPMWVSSSYDEHGVYQPGFYTMTRPPPPSPSPTAPPARPNSPEYPSTCPDWCTSTVQSGWHSLEYVCRGDNGRYCSGCDHCITYLEEHPEPNEENHLYSYRDMSGPWDEATETPLETSLRSIYTSLAPVCLIFSTLA